MSAQVVLVLTAFVLLIAGSIDASQYRGGIITYKLSSPNTVIINLENDALSTNTHNAYVYLLSDKDDFPSSAPKKKKIM